MSKSCGTPKRLSATVSGETMVSNVAELLASGGYIPVAALE
jgi:hypothetical protein